MSNLGKKHPTLYVSNEKTLSLRTEDDDTLVGQVYYPDFANEVIENARLRKIYEGFKAQVTPDDKGSVVYDGEYLIRLFDAAMKGESDE